MSPQYVSQLCRAGALDFGHDDEGRVKVDRASVEEYVAKQAREESDPRRAAKRREVAERAERMRREASARRAVEREESREWRHAVRASLERLAAAFERMVPPRGRRAAHGR